MSQILSVILVIMMVFSSAGSMIAKTDEPVFLEAQVSADAQSVLAMAGAGGSDADGRIQQDDGRRIHLRQQPAGQPDAVFLQGNT